MPRSHFNNISVYGGSYSWYAATAESGTYEMVTGDASDSICPKGWSMPLSRSDNVPKSWMGLLYHAYGYRNGSITYHLPVSIVGGGVYGMTNGIKYAAGTQSSYWSSTPTAEAGRAGYAYLTTGGGFSPTSSYRGAYGFTVRCVIK